MRPVLLLVVSVFSLAWALPAPSPAATPAEIKKLIDQLGDDDTDVRKEAAKKLEALGEEALPALREAAKSAGDADIRLRAAVIVSAIHKKLYGEIFTLAGHKGWVYRVIVLPGGKQAISSGDFLRVWDL